MADRQDDDNLSNKKAGVVIDLPLDREISAEHRDHLRSSGLSDETIEAAALYTLRHQTAIAQMLGWSRWRNGPVLVFPYMAPGQETPIFYRVRPDQPRTRKAKDGKRKIIKYEQPKGVGIAPYFTPRTLAEGWLEDPRRPLVFTEGEKKALLLDQLGYATIGGAGVWCFHDPAARDEGGGFQLHPLIRDHARLASRKTVICFDSDAAHNSDVMRAARVLAGMLLAEGVTGTSFVRIPPTSSGGKQGIDDLFVNTGAGDGAKSVIWALMEEAEALEPVSIREPLLKILECRGLGEAPVPKKLLMPGNYYTDRFGQIYAKSDDPDDPVDKLVERRPVLIRGLLRDQHSDEMRVELTFKTTSDGWRDATVPRQAICDTRACVTELSKHGAAVDATSVKRVIQFLRDIEHVNGDLLPVTPCVRRAGWNRIAGREVFATNEVIAPRAREGDPDLPRIVVDGFDGTTQILSALHTDGELELHKHGLRVAFREDPVAATFICAAFAAPLLYKVGCKNFVVHVPGDSSRGKTSMLKMAASLYGDPESEDWVASWHSTQVGMEYRAATLCDLPLCFDESSVVDRETLEKNVYMLVNGVGKVRGARGGGVRDTMKWRTIILSTGENPLADERAKSGAQARVLELYVAGDGGGMSAATVDDLRTTLGENYGHVGRAWIEHLLGMEDWRPVREAYRKLVKLYQEDTRGGGIDARQASYLALLVLTEQWISELFQIGDPEGLTMDAWFHASPEHRRQTTPLADRALRSVVDWWHSAPQSFPELSLMPDGEEEPKDHGARELFGYRDRTAVWIIPTRLRDWFERQGLPYETVLRSWKDRDWILVDGRDRRGFQKSRRIRGAKSKFVAIRRDVFEARDDSEPDEDFADGTAHAGTVA